MFTREIPRNLWIKFFDDFGNQYKGWTVNLEIFDFETGVQRETHELELAGFIIDLKESGDTVTVLIGSSPTAHVSHPIKDVRRVLIGRSDVGAGDAVKIESKDGNSVLLSFCSSRLPAKFAVP